MGHSITMKGGWTRRLSVFPPFLSSCGRDRKHLQTRRPCAWRDLLTDLLDGFVFVRRRRGYPIPVAEVGLPDPRDPTQPNPTSLADDKHSAFRRNHEKQLPAKRIHCHLTDANQSLTDEPKLRTLSRLPEAVAIGCEFATISEFQPH